jgi:hypothetical protein
MGLLLCVERSPARHDYCCMASDPRTGNWQPPTETPAERQARQAQEGVQAMAEYRAAEEALRLRTKELRAMRQAREAIKLISTSTFSVDATSNTSASGPGPRQVPRGGIVERAQHKRTNVMPRGDKSSYRAEAPSRAHRRRSRKARDLEGGGGESCMGNRE